MISRNSTLFPAFRAAFPDIHWVIEEMVAEGDKVFSHFTWNGTHREEFFGVPATGRQIIVKGPVVDRVVAGRRQLGVIPRSTIEATCRIRVASQLTVD